jgi:hypothetical protein
MPISRAGVSGFLKSIFRKYGTIRKSAFSKKSITYYQKIIFIKSYFELDFLKIRNIAVSHVCRPENKVKEIYQIEICISHSFLAIKRVYGKEFTAFFV